MCLIVCEIIPGYAEAKSLSMTPLSPSTVTSEHVDNLGLSHGVGLSLDSSPLCDWAICLASSSVSALTTNPNTL